MSTSPNSACAACKYMKRKCTQECVFAPYFPANEPQRYACVHRVYGASIVMKLLKELSTSQREDAVKSLIYEAEAHLHYPNVLRRETMSSKKSACAACRYARRKCTQECVFAPYFPANEPQRYACVHRVYGASFVMKLLKELSASQREDAIISLKYEAEARFRNPVHGCAGYISMLQQRLSQMENELYLIKKVLSNYVSPHAMQWDTQQQELLEAQQLAAAQQQRELMLRFGGFELLGGGGSGDGLNQMGGGGGDPGRLALGNFDNVRLDQIQQQQQGEQQHHHPHTHVPHSYPHAIETLQLLLPQKHHDKQGLEDLLDGGNGGGLNQMGGGGGPARLAMGNLDSVSLYQIQQPQQGEQQHDHPHTHVPNSPPHAIETQQLLTPQQHHDTEGLEDLLRVFDVGHNP